MSIEPQLLETATDEEVPGFIKSLDYWMQEKHDGYRLLVEVTPESIRGINRQGTTVPVPPSIRKELEECPRSCILDGEIVSGPHWDTYHVFDALMIGGGDLSEFGYASRYSRLVELFCKFNSADEVRISKPVTAPESKQIAFDALKKSAEGVVFRKVDQRYQGGRNRAVMKYKFYSTASFIVTGRNEKGSACLALMTGDRLTPVGNVTIPISREMPAAGSIVEVRYLYAHAKSGAIYQPVYIGERDDVSRSECVVSQLKYKNAH